VGWASREVLRGGESGRVGTRGVEELRVRRGEVGRGGLRRGVSAGRLAAKRAAARLH
jgi:hypothetical protein